MLNRVVMLTSSFCKASELICQFKDVQSPFFLDQADLCIGQNRRSHNKYRESTNKGIVIAVPNLYGKFSTLPSGELT